MGISSGFLFSLTNSPEYSTIKTEDKGFTIRGTYYDGNIPSGAYSWHDRMKTRLILDARERLIKGVMSDKEYISYAMDVMNAPLGSI